MTAADSDGVDAAGEVSASGAEDATTSVAVNQTTGTGEVPDRRSGLGLEAADGPRDGADVHRIAAGRCCAPLDTHRNRRWLSTRPPARTDRRPS